MAKCPYCEYVTPEPDDGDGSVRAWQEVAHMQAEHPDIIRKRLEQYGPVDLPTRLREDDI